MSPPERETLEHLVSEHHARLSRMAIRMTGDLEPAEEIMQEALLRIVNGWSGFRGQSTFPTWATRILLNVFHDWLAKRRPAEPLADASDPRQADPASCAEAQELRRYVAQRVSALPPRQREVLVLMTYEGHTADEVAQLLEIQVSCVYANLYQARQRLRTELAPFLADGDGKGTALATENSRASGD